MSALRKRQEEYLEEVGLEGAGCASCFFFEEYSKGNGYCKRYPSMDPVDSYSWCGEFLPSVAFLTFRESKKLKNI